MVISDGIPQNWEEKRKEKGDKSWIHKLIIYMNLT